MPEIVDPRVDAYVTDRVPARDAALAAVEADATQRHLPIVGPQEGQFLYVLALSSGTRTVLELGACTGYSAIWLGRAVAPRGGRVLTIERDPERARETRANVGACGLGEVVEVRQGDALEIVASLTEQFDLVFNDLLRALGADDAQMRRLFELTLARVRSGGLLVADNALHGGDVVEPGSDAGAAAVALYNRLAGEHPELVTTLVPMRDGISISYRR